MINIYSIFIEFLIYYYNYLRNLNIIIDNYQFIALNEGLNTSNSNIQFWDKNLENFKILINNYILDNYYVFNNVSESFIFNAQTLIQFVKLIFINFEGILIFIQKITYEIFGYFFDLFNWYFNYKILLDKLIISSNLIEDIYYNISLELLMDIESENIKSLLLLLENNNNNDLNIKNNQYLALFKNYFEIFKSNPYKLNMELLNLYKFYPRSNILSYGIDYDINIMKNDKYLLSLFDLNISNKEKLNKIFIDYSISNYNIVEKSQGFYKNMMLFTDIETNKIIDIENKYNVIILNKFKESHRWFTRNDYFFFETENQNNKNEWYTMFGGYSYWWGWHQDAVYIHGKKGPGGAPLWDDYIQWKLSKKNKFFVTFIPKHIKKIKHGVKLYNYYPGKITKRLTMFYFDWDLKKKRKFIKYILHGRRVWEMEKLFFKNFFLSDDLWVKKLYGFGGSSSKFYWDNINLNSHRYRYDLEREGIVGMHDRVMYIRFGINSPEMVYKKKSKLVNFWFAFINNDDDLTKHIKWKKSRMYDYIFSILEDYYNLSKDMHNASMEGIRGFFMKQFVLDFWLNKDKLKLLNYTTENQITWDIFYTNIESVTEPLNLNYINKNFYGRHFYDIMDSFIIDKSNLSSDFQIPKNTNLLLKKTYIENLIYVYQKEEEPMINYIKYKRIPSNFLFFLNNMYIAIYWLYLDFIETYLALFNEIIKMISKKLMTIKQIRFIKEYHDLYKENYKYFIIFFIILLYSLICSFLIILIKSFLPKNLVYGVKTYTKSTWKNIIWDLIDPINSRYGKDNNLGYHRYIEDTLIHLENMSRLLNIKDVNEQEKHYKYNKDFNVDSIYDRSMFEKFYFILKRRATLEDAKEDLLKKKNKKLYLRKNFFDAEHRYIYSWEKRYDKIFEDKTEITIKERQYQFDWVPERTYNNIDKKKNLLIKKNYNIFFQKFIFEKNLEKWENNTKIRADILLWAKYLGTSAYGLIRGLFLYYRDRRFNHNRTIIWDDPLLEKESKVKYYFVMPKLFFNIFFAVRFTIGAIRLWDYKYWIRRWRQYVLYGRHTRVSYKELKIRLEKEWTLEWYKDMTDYGAAMFYKDYSKLVKKFEDIKKTPDDKKAEVYQDVRADMILNILEMTIESDKYKEMLAYKKTMDNIAEERLINSFDRKFDDIRIKLLLDVGKISPKKWAEQEIMYKYRTQVYEQKLAIEKEEYAVLKQSYETRMNRDMDDDEKTLVFLEWEHQKNIKSIMESKIAAVAYEKQLREFNFKNKIIDSELDRKEQVFFESIPEYKEDLNIIYAKLDELENLKRSEDTKYERKSRILYDGLEKHYLWFRWYTTMGNRLNFLLSQIMGIFVAWVENIEKIRKNEHSIESLFLIMYTDISEFIYKMYWEYLIIWNRYKTLKKLGINIVDILRFSLILTPIIIYTGSLYILFFLYLLLNNIIKKSLNKFYIIQWKKQYIDYYLKDIFYNLKLWFNVLFRDLKTGNTIFEILYLKFYKLCGWIQYNIYYTKGAFILGYKEQNILGGIKKILLYFNLKYKAYKEQHIENKNVIDELRIWYKSKKNNIIIKLELLLVIINIKYFFIRLHGYIVNFLYKYIFKPIFKIKSHTFYVIYLQNMMLLKHYYNIYLNNFSLLLNLFKKLNFFEFITLFFKWIFIILTMPVRFLINHQRWKYITNYKQGIQGFRNNPMRIIINRPKQKNDWRVKLHKLLMNGRISRILRDIKLSRESLLEIFLMYKVEEVRWANKNTFQEHFWKSLYWNTKTLKETILSNLIYIMQEIEEGYKSFEQSIELRNWSYWDRIKYSYYMYKAVKNVDTVKEQKRISRDLFFKKKIKDKRKFMRIYFIKGILNWLTYITINKVIFTKIKDATYNHKKLKYNGLKHKHIKYKSFKFKKSVHISNYLNNIPPQFWGLVILYDIYFKYLLRYKYDNFKYPLDWQNEFQYTKMYKWRLAAPEHNPDIPFYDRRKIAADLNTYHYNSFAKNLSTAPFDPMIRWALFLLEFGFSKEDIIFDGKEVWGDVSMTHLLTYNKVLDAYQYEIRDYNRLLKGFSLFRFAEDSLEKDKKEHYERRYEMVSKNLIIKNKNILENVLKKRRLKAAESLHKALLRNTAKTLEQKEAELEEERDKDYFYVRKREFFDTLKIEHYFEWKAQFDSKIIEDKYFNTNDMDHVTFDSKITEDFYNAHGIIPTPLRYLVENIVLKSYDQTLEEIFYFLKFKVWKILEKKQIKKVINYKNLYIKPSFFKKINYLDYKEKKKKKAIVEKDIDGKKEKVEEFVDYYEYKYEPLEWELTKTEPLYGFVENNYFSIYFETGALFTYQDKIEFNDHATPYYKPEILFHGNETLLRFSKFIYNRHMNLKDLKKSTMKKLKKKKIKLHITLAYINNVRWTWEQWLGYGDITKETELLNKNIIILNERFRVWNLKRAPIRLKLPICLNVMESAALDFFKEGANYASLEHRYFLLSSGVHPLVYQSLVWWECKEDLEKHFNKSITDIVFWIFRAGAFDAQVREIKKEFAFVLRNFAENFNVFNKIYFLGMQSYSWDLIRYHDVWIGEDEFPFHKYYILKQIEFLNHDPAAKRIVAKVHNLGIDRYKPINYIYFFKHQYISKFWYNIYGILSFSCFFWILKVLFYNPGEYISAYYMLMTPLFLCLAFWYLRRYLADGKDVSEGAELYLYRHHSSKSYSKHEWAVMAAEELETSVERMNFFIDDAKKIKLFGTIHPQINIKQNEKWWRYHSHLNSSNDHYTYKHMRYFIVMLSFYVWMEYWQTQKFRHRNHWILWDFYRYDEQMYYFILEQGEMGPRNYQERKWYMDSFSRLESGGNLYSRWYENTYKRRWKEKIMEMDYGYDWQKIKDLDITMYLGPRRIIHLPSSYSDASWIDLSRLLRAYIPEELKDGREWTKYKNVKKRLTYKDYMEHADGVTENSEVKKIVKWYGEDRINVLQHAFYELKKDFKRLLFEHYLGMKPPVYNPLQHWFDFQKLILDFYNYDLVGNDYMQFIFDSKIKTNKLIKQDITRYFLKKDNNVVEYVKPLIDKHEIFLIKKKSFETGSSLDIKTLLSISEQEKHLTVLSHNFIQCKLKRLDLLLKSENIDYNISEIVNSKSEMELYLKKCEQYIINIFKNISYEDKITYKCNLLLKLWNEKQWSWWMIKNIFYNNSSILEILDILIKFINKIL